MTFPFHSTLTALLGAALTFSSVHVSAITSNDTPLPAEVFFTPNLTQLVKLSPSGRWLATQSAPPGERALLTVIDLEGKEPARVIAKFTRFDVTSFSWVNDDWIVFGLFDPNDKSGKKYSNGLNSVRRDGEKMRALIKREYESEFQEQGKVALEPTNSMLSIGAPGTNEIIIGEDHYDSQYHYKATTLRAMDISTGALRSLFKDTPAPPGDIKTWIIDQRGQPRLAVSSKNGKSTVFWADPATGQWRQIAHFDSLHAPFSPAYVDEKDQLFVQVINPDTSLSELRQFNFSTGKPADTVIVSLPGFDANAMPISENGNNKVHGLRLTTDALNVAWFTPAMTALQSKVDNMLPGRVNVLNCRQCDNPERVLVYSYSDTSPGDYLLYTRTTDSLARIAETRPGHPEEKMANVELIRTKTRDGADLPVWITKTAGAGPRPAVVLVHGGPWSRGREWEWESDSQFLATRGYVVIEPEFRGSTGFGQNHFRAGWKQWGQLMQDDVTDALRSVIAQGIVDPKRVCIAGASYGGYSTLMGLAKDPDLYRCGVAWLGVTDPRYMFSVHWSDIGDDSKKYSMPEMIGDPEKDDAMLAANAPIELASKIKAPVLLAYGAKDRRVPLVHGEKMRQALIEAGSPPEWIVYDDEAHGWRRPKNKIDFWKKVEAFLAKQLK